MSARVVFAPDALVQLESTHHWWRANRSAAPSMFIDELQAALELISALPRVGRAVRHPRRRGVRRVLLRRSRVHVFYQYDAASDVIRIAAVWGAVRGAPPPLG